MGLVVWRLLGCTLCSAGGACAAVLWAMRHAAILKGRQRLTQICLVLSCPLHPPHLPCPLHPTAGRPWPLHCLPSCRLQPGRTARCRQGPSAPWCRLSSCCPCPVGCRRSRCPAACRRCSWLRACHRPSAAARRCRQRLSSRLFPPLPSPAGMSSLTATKSSCLEP